jgi:hypothetical protein
MLPVGASVYGIIIASPQQSDVPVGLLRGLGATEESRLNLGYSHPTETQEAQWTN